MTCRQLLLAAATMLLAAQSAAEPLPRIAIIIDDLGYQMAAGRRAVAIGHPFPETLAVLERELPKLRAEGFELVTISELLTKPLNRI